jgi:hypothetical protein
VPGNAAHCRTGQSRQPTAADQVDNDRPGHRTTGDHRQLVRGDDIGVLAGQEVVGSQSSGLREALHVAAKTLHHRVHVRHLHRHNRRRSGDRRGVGLRRFCRGSSNRRGGRRPGGGLLGRSRQSHAEGHGSGEQDHANGCHDEFLLPANVVGTRSQSTVVLQSRHAPPLTCISLADRSL